ncbi:dCTP deaminase domain-containing protein [Phytohabitans houttuyneae]
MIDAGLLGKSEILKRLEADQIIRHGTWDRSQLKGAGYDVRMASDLLFITDPDGEPVKYAVGEHRIDPVILQPSSVALVSTKERFAFPSDIGAHVSVKWSWARKGVLVLTGGFVNPGFGFEWIGSRLEKSPDERLHFLIVNVGSEPQTLIPGITALASLQFATIVGESGNFPADSTQELISTKYAADAPNRALSLFPQLVEQNERLNRLSHRLERVEHGTAPLVTFGVYLLAVTFLGVLLNAGITFASDERVVKLSEEIPRTWPFALVAICAMGTVALIVKKILDVVIAALNAYSRSPRRSR